jgi:hypothetical protein
MRGTGSSPSITSRSECAAPLSCSLRSRFFFTWPPAALRALAGPFGAPPVGCASLNRSLSGRFELAHFARLGSVTAFLRYAERLVLRSALRAVTSTLCRVRTWQCASVRQAAHHAGFQATSIMSRAGVSRSALLPLQSGGGSARPNRRQSAPSCSP